MVFCKQIVYLGWFTICALGIIAQLGLIEGLGEKKYGQYCSGYVDRSCNQSLHLICVDKRCECRNPATMVYDKASDSCVTILNRPCYQEGFFMTNPKGYKDSTKFYQGVKYERKLPCGKNAICDETSKKCICQNPLDPGTNGTCTKPPIGEFICDFDHMVCPSGSGLRCVDGHCLCRFPHLQYFNGTRCISRVGGPCENDKESHLECTPDAECVRVGRHNRCVCSNGFTQTKEGLCVPGYGQHCVYGTQCGGDGDFLHCVDGQCRCSDDLYIFDTSQRRCRGLVGSYCKVEGVDTTFVDKHFCIDGASCAPKMYESMDGVCTCKPGHFETRMRTCESQI